MLFNLFKKRTSDFDSFVRVWRGVVYSVADSELIYKTNHRWPDYLYKISSDHYFTICEGVYKDFIYKPMSTQEAINWLCNRVDDANSLIKIKHILKDEFNYDLS